MVKVASLGGMSHFFLLHSILAALVRHIYLILLSDYVLLSKFLKEVKVMSISTYTKIWPLGKAELISNNIHCLSASNSCW